MLHKGKAHTYGLEGNFGIAYGASIVWFIGSLVFGIPILFTIPVIGFYLLGGGVGISWILGLIAFSHRKNAWTLLTIETISLILLAFTWWIAG